MSYQRWWGALITFVCAGACGDVAPVKVDARMADSRPADSSVSGDAPLCAARPANLVSWWPAEGHAMDVVGANEGSLVGGAYAAGQVGQAFRLSAANQYVTVADAATLDFATQITIEGWIYPEVIISERIVDKITPGQGDGFLLDINASKLRFIIQGRTLSSGASIVAQQWTHVAAAYDAANVRLYINGALDAAIAHTGPIVTNALVLTIGAQSDHVGSFFNGNLDEITVYDRGLTEPEIAAIHAAGTHGKCAQ
jgi:hypothetical protein